MSNRKEYMKAYYQAHKEEAKVAKKAWYEAHKDQAKAYIQAHKEQIKERKKAYYQAHKDAHKASMKANYESHKEQRKAIMKAYYQAHKDAHKAAVKAWIEANKEKVKAYMQSDVNSLGQTKASIRNKSRRILKKSGIKIPGYQIHHCFGYEDPSKFIYCSKSLHLKIHQYLRDNNIDADIDHWLAISHIVNSTYEFIYIKS